MRMAPKTELVKPMDTYLAGHEAFGKLLDLVRNESGRQDSVIHNLEGHKSKRKGLRPDRA